MQDVKPRLEATDSERKIAKQFVNARLEARTLLEYPGAMPPDRAAAYRIQDAAIAIWPDTIAGWKTTMVIPPQYGSDFVGKRLVGPAFRSAIRIATPGVVVDCPVIAGGFSGLEPEIIVRVGSNAPSDKLEWTIDEAMEMVGDLCIGAEVVTSPLASLPTCGIPATASDFGMNCGAVVGPSIADWQRIDRFEAQAFINGELDSSGGISLREGVIDSFAFALGECAHRGYPLEAGAVITTGTLTTFHMVQPGNSARFVYSGLGEIAIQMVEMQPTTR